MGEQFDKKIRIYVGSGKKNRTESGLKVDCRLSPLFTREALR